jgi:uncharacterized OB-fold protein
VTPIGAAQREIPAPRVNPETATFWEAAASGKLLVKKCERCGEVHWYPRALCPFCFSDATVWLEASGRGVIHSYSVMRRVPQLYVIAYVTLEEGVTMLTNIVECDADSLYVGQPVRVLFVPSSGGPPVPMFAPREDALQNAEVV